MSLVCFLGGVLLGSYGVKVLTSADAKKAYVKGTAAVLRMKDEVVKDATLISENCADIAAELGLNADAVLFLISTEGDTDPANYRRIVGAAR